MGFFDFLKRRKKKKKNRKTELENTTKKLDISEIENFVESRLKEDEKKERKILDSLNQKKQSFAHELGEKLKILKNVPLDSKKADLKIKLIVEGNKNRYIQNVEEIKERLNNLEAKNLKEFMNKINEIFLNFYNKSHINYEKATILIGREIAEIKNMIKNFSKNLMKTFDENFIKEISNLSELKLKLNQVYEINSELKEIEKSLNSLDKASDENKKRKEDFFNKIKEIKTSEKYKENLKMQNELKKLQEEQESLILNLKQEINFKELANFFHIFPESIKIVKDYKENFLKKFKQDKENILNLIDKANLKNSAISERVMQIKEKEDDIQEKKQKMQEDETLACYNEIKKLDLKIRNINEIKEKKYKRKKKLEENKKNLVDFLELEVNKIK